MVALGNAGNFHHERAFGHNVTASFQHAIERLGRVLTDARQEMPGD
jgi:hypothetical protein